MRKLTRGEFITLLGVRLRGRSRRARSSLTSPVIGLLSGVSFESYPKRRNRNVSYQGTAV
jgi:hypothetical protein